MSSFWIDTDCLISAKNGPYPMKSKVGSVFWSMIEDGFESGLIKMPRQVFNEIRKGRRADDPLKQWLSLREHLCTPTPKAVQSFSQKVGDYLYARLDRYDLRHVVDFSKGADVWVVACASNDNGAVVTNEKPEPLTKKPKVADMCSIFGVRRIDRDKLVFCLENNIKPDHCTDPYRD